MPGACAVAEFELLEVVGAIDSLGASDAVEGLATSQWLSRNGQCSMPTARKRVRAAKALRSKLPDEAVDLVRDGAVEATLVVQHDDTDLRVFDERVRLLNDTAVSRLLCDSTLVPVVLDALGKPIDVGDRFRLARSHQRRALKARGGGCCMPGCDATVAIAQAHHIVPFPQSKRTDVDNLMNLCPKHHGVVHRTGWSAELTADGWTVFTRPDGHRFWGQRRGKQREGLVPHPGSGPPG